MSSSNSAPVSQQVPLKRVYRCAVNTKPLNISSSSNLAGLSKKMAFAKKLQLSNQRGTRFCGLIKLNAFGSFNGAPGGAGEPPKNTF